MMAGFRHLSDTVEDFFFSIQWPNYPVASPHRSLLFHVGLAPFSFPKTL